MNWVCQQKTKTLGPFVTLADMFIKYRCKTVEFCGNIGTSLMKIANILLVISNKIDYLGPATSKLWPSWRYRQWFGTVCRNLFNEHQYNCWVFLIVCCNFGDYAVRNAPPNVIFWIVLQIVENFWQLHNWKSECVIVMNVPSWVCWRNPLQYENQHKLLLHSFSPVVISGWAAKCCDAQWKDEILLAL